MTNLVYYPAEDAGAATRPFIFIIPGGGFEFVCTETEGGPIAALFNNLGYHAFVLTYRVAVHATSVKAMEDIARALRIITQGKDEYHINPEEYMTCGFSAGGYITCLWNTELGYPAYNLPKPRACFPIYPITSVRIMRTEEWEGGEDKEVVAQEAVGCSMEEACNSVFEIPEHVSAFPPTALFAAAEDTRVDPEHSRVLAKALEKAGIPYRLEIGPHGEHGFATGIGMCMEGWPARAIAFAEQVASNDHK